MILTRGVMLNTLVHNMSIHKGSQWFVLVPTHVAARIYNGSDRVCPAGK